jgi:ATP-binding cassette subfamily B protein
MFHFNYQDAPKDVRLTRKDLTRIARHLLPAWRPCLLILGCIVVTALAGLVPPLLVREVIDRAIPQRNGALLNGLVTGMIAIPLVSGLIGVWQNHLVTLMSQDVMFRLRDEIYGRMLGQSLRFFTTVKSGEILSRIQNDVGGVQGVVSGTFVSLASNGLVIATTLVVIFRLDWRLSLIAVGVLPAFILPTRKVGQSRSRIAGKTQEKLSEMTSHLQETLSVSGFLLTRLFGAQAHERERFREKTSAVRALQIQQALAGRWFLMWLLMFGSVGPALIYLAGGHGAIAGRLSLGTVVAFVAYLGRLYMPASALVNAHVDVMSAVSLFRRIFEYIDLPIEVADPPHPVPLASPRGELRFESVSMGYEEGRLTLEDVSFEALPGTMVALVGPSGAGKTTLTYLASRLYDPGRGRVTLDGVDLREISLADLSRVTAKVTQETTLFHATVEENLRYAKPDATAEELATACRLAQIQGVIDKLPQGLATVVGERGYKLSGGERQRIALARVFLRDPRLLILDEATSSLDSRSEALIQAALEPLLAGRTSLVIAHRLSTILRADLILVLDRGRIVERGTHAELLARGGLYAQLYEQQFRASEVEPTA